MGSMDGDGITQRDAYNIVRNVIWSINPNCVQCLKYHDKTFVLDMVKPFFFFGVMKDFVKMRRYMTGRNKFTYDISADQSDSEDDISDNPDLDLEEDRSRKINIKKKRIAEKKKL